VCFIIFFNITYRAVRLDALMVKAMKADNNKVLEDRLYARHHHRYLFSFNGSISSRFTSAPRTGFTQPTKYITILYNALNNSFRELEFLFVALLGPRLIASSANP